MKLEPKDLINKLQPTLEFLKRYTKFIFLIAMLFAAIFLVYRINEFSRLEPSTDDVTEKLQTVPRPKVDPDVLSKIQQLQDQNVQVQSIFEQARNNPFSE